MITGMVVKWGFVLMRLIIVWYWLLKWLQSLQRLLYKINNDDINVKTHQYGKCVPQLSLALFCNLYGTYSKKIKPGREGRNCKNTTKN